MTIKEMEQRTGLTRSNIRFYEKEELISPLRDGKNGYRDYSEEDVKTIRKVAYLRTLGISVEEIRRLSRQEADMYEVLKEQSQQLEQQLSDLQQAKRLCERMLSSKEALDYVNAVDSKNIGILLDTYHMNIEEFSIGNAIRTAGKKLVGFHVGENNRSVPGRGHLDWDEIFCALHDVDYKGRIVAEPFVVTGGEVGRDIYVWRNLIDNTDEESLDKEALFMLDFEKKMLAKWGM